MSRLAASVGLSACVREVWLGFWGIFFETVLMLD